MAFGNALGNSIVGVLSRSGNRDKVETANSKAGKSLQEEGAFDQFTPYAVDAPPTLGDESMVACFVKGTLIHTQKGMKPIEAVTIGDMVLAQPDLKGERAYKPVANIFSGSEKRIVELQVFNSEQSETIFTTEKHPFWVVDHGWKKAADIEPGSLLELANGKIAQVETVVDTGRIEPVFNFEVSDFHTYYVGELGVWVHNTSAVQPTTDSIALAELTGNSDLATDEQTILFLSSQRRSRGNGALGDQAGFSIVDGALTVESTPDNPYGVAPARLRELSGFVNGSYSLDVDIPDLSINELSHLQDLVTLQDNAFEFDTGPALVPDEGSFISEYEIKRQIQEYRTGWRGTYQYRQATNMHDAIALAGGELAFGKVFAEIASISSKVYYSLRGERALTNAMLKAEIRAGLSSYSPASASVGVTDNFASLTPSGFGARQIILDPTDAALVSDADRLVRSVFNKFDEIKAAGTGNRKTGPVLTGVLNRDTGEIFYALNQTQAQTYVIPRLHPVLEARRLQYLSNAEQAGLGIDALGKQLPGTHAEVKAVSQALDAIGPNASANDLNKMIIFNLRARGVSKGSSIIRCNNCQVMTTGVPSISDNPAFEAILPSLRGAH
tara:strand:- start:1613 stop:3448 length:1836 start_codon:yes stop_codon:yes gene_type:complete